MRSFVFWNAFITMIFWSVVLGKVCKLSSGKEGYCREKDDCFGPTEDADCGSGLKCCAGSGKAKEKCQEYSKYTKKESFGSALTARIIRVNESECKIEATPLIVGGIKANAKEFPHMVGIGYGADVKNAKWLCGGTLISENYVLTAAHCSVDSAGEPASYIRVGTLNIQKPAGENWQEVKVEKVINHPKYKFPSKYHDICLLKLQSSVKMDGAVRPACLHSTPNEFEIKKGIASGWGKLNSEDTTGSPELMKVTLSFFQNDKCKSFYSSDVGSRFLKDGIIDQQICAGEEKGGKDTCQGDSGGPLQTVLKEPYCMYSVMGVTSFGKFCGFENSPAVYSRVYYYIPWIESVVWP